MRALRKVLVVDDDPVVGKSFDRVLSGKGYAVITASDGPEALKKLETEDYDVVFTDIKMPGMSGIEVVERVKQKRPWLPVVIVTGYGSPENKSRAEAAGVSAFLDKPLSPEMIEGSAEKALLEKDAGMAGTSRAEATPLPAPAQAAPASFGRILKNVALFFAAPFVGLAYIIAFPFVGLGMLAWYAGKSMMKYGAGRMAANFMTKTGLLIGGPLLGLAFVLLMPWVGAVILAWIGARALLKRSGVE